MSAPLPEGSYDVFIVDAEDRDDAQMLSLTVTAGDHKGMVLDVLSASLGRDDIELMGLPATLTIRDGQPQVRIDD